MAAEFVRTEDINSMLTYTPREKSAEAAEAGDKDLNSGLVDISVPSYGDVRFKINKKAVGYGRARYAGGRRSLAGEGYCFPPGLAARCAGSARRGNRALGLRQQCTEVIR
jgi:hypothetical protein